ncbi:MAG: type II secretion system secretin GspD [Bdellovibrionota bacterium]|nr:type II secretion system secretin GspD [Bdellovibrionota bacterium]
MKKSFVLLTLLNLPLYAQFDKYKSKSNFDRKESRESITKLAEDRDGSRDEPDVFGRMDKELPKSDKKYVNLNPETAFGPEVVTSFDFKDASLEDLTTHMQKMTGLNLILDKDLKGKITISAPTPITVGDAWQAYLAALNMNGLTMVKSGAFYKIVKARDIRYVPTKIYTGNYVPDTENYMMKIISLKNINSTEVSRSFRPFMSRYGRIIEIKQTNTIIIQDTGANINRLMRLIKFIDVPGHEETLQIIPVKHTSASEIAKLLDKILKEDSSKKVRASSSATKGEIISKITAEPRTNSIIAMANADGAKRLNALIKRLDVKLIAGNNEQIHVYYLFHGDAEELSKTLSTLVSGSKPSATTSRRSRRTSRFSSSSSSEANSLFNAEVRVTADKSNNALVITASPTDWLTMEKVIKKLDVPKDQVFVEGLIMETNVNSNKDVGVSIVGAYGTGGADRAGFLGGASGNALQGLISNQWQSVTGLFAGLGLGGEVQTNINGTEVTLDSVNALITAIKNNSDTNVLATPQLLVQDNTEGVFEVGETVPVPEITNAVNGTTQQNIRQQQVALTLKITPQINRVTRFVKLKIDQQVDDFSGRNVGTSGGVGTTIRKAVTTVTVRDRDTIAMGGLMRDKTVETESKVPLLGDIPVLGWLFKNRNSSVEKVNMLFFLTPRILSNYQRDTAETVKDGLNRRAAHLKDVYGEDDPFGTTAKGLYDKAKKQEKGPLYDQEEADFYKRENKKGIDGYAPQGSYDPRKVKQNLKFKKSALKKNKN